MEFSTLIHECRRSLRCRQYRDWIRASRRSCGRGAAEVGHARAVTFGGVVIRVRVAAESEAVMDSHAVIQANPSRRASRSCARAASAG